jgi:hypothetical protein
LTGARAATATSDPGFSLMAGALWLWSFLQLSLLALLLVDLCLRHNLAHWILYRLHYHYPSILEIEQMEQERLQAIEALEISGSTLG